MVLRKKTAAKKEVKKVAKPKAKRIRKQAESAAELKPTRKAIQLPKGDFGEKAERQPTLHSRTIELVLSGEYTDSAMKEMLAAEFPDKNRKGYVSFVRSGINHGVIAKNIVYERGIQLPIEKVGV